MTGFLLLAAVFVSGLSGLSLGDDGGDDLLPDPPNLVVVPEVLTQEACNELIEMSEAHGWNMRVDSIDHYKKPSVDIYVLDKGIVLKPKFWRWMSPIVPRIKELVRKYSADPDTFESSIDWVFIRKYSADVDTKRDALRGHRDTNEYTFIVPLNHNFEGGELWFLRPSVEVDSESYNVPAEWPRKNTSAYFLPRIKGGEAIIYDNKVSHGYV